ncbi:hypothetical protein [Jiangella rhizosphaerae]|uniref:Uncharacterized protein n=1 Tax=Jiangella rhizosphaerae TaxID=2293569 RepID=A0A418KUX4_9ACTN|nr:hypothetical protein [Jiangella rhizosphaerae]RIQ33626.1 hypothetical protein DY240_04975 [Jiangella rhizosphaerae]
MTADLEFGAPGDPAAASRPGAPVRSPAMRAYCASLARFTSSVQSTEQLLRNDDAGTREDTEQRELTAATRLRGIDRAGAAADDGLAHCAAVRSDYGLPSGSPADAFAEYEERLGADGRDRPGGGGHADDGTVGTAEDGGTVGPAHDRGSAGPAHDRSTAGPPRDRGTAGLVRHPDSGPSHGTDGSLPGTATAVRSGTRRLRTSPGRLDDAAPGLDRLRRTGGADLGVALTALGRRRDELKLAEAEFAHWLQMHDEQSRRITLGAVVAAGLAGAAVMAVAGVRTSAATALALLIVCSLAVVAAGLGVAAARRLPRVCRGAGLARRPDGWALARYGARIGGATLLALTAANIVAGAL